MRMVVGLVPVSWPRSVKPVRKSTDGTVDGGADRDLGAVDDARGADVRGAVRGEASEEAVAVGAVRRAAELVVDPRAPADRRLVELHGGRDVPIQGSAGEEGGTVRAAPGEADPARGAGHREIARVGLGRPRAADVGNPPAARHCACERVVRRERCNRREREDRAGGDGGDELHSFPISLAPVPGRSSVSPGATPKRRCNRVHSASTLPMAFSAPQPAPHRPPNAP